MCLLTFIPGNTEFNYERASISAKANPDGFGFAIHAGIAIIKDHDMDFNKLWERWDDLRKTYKGSAMFHFRIATHGVTTIDNCHPFDIDNNPKNVMGHNGILPLTMPLNDDRSDSKLFAEIVLPYIGGVKALDDEKTRLEIGKWANGNKLVILSADEETQHAWYIINEHLGHWDQNVWWSNSSYKKSYPYTYVNYGYGQPVTNKPKPANYYDEDEVYASAEVGYKRDDIYDDGNYGYGWTRQDEIDYIEDELYPDAHTLNMIRTFTDYSQLSIATVTCNQCSASFLVDPLEPSPTHCGECKCCLHCGNNSLLEKTECKCWDEYDYGQSYVVWDTDNTQFSLDHRLDCQ